MGKERRSSYNGDYHTDLLCELSIDCEKYLFTFLSEKDKFHSYDLVLIYKIIFKHQ